MSETKICPELTAARLTLVGGYYEQPCEASVECIGKACGKYNLCNGIHLTTPAGTWAGAGIREISPAGEKGRGLSAGEIIEANRKAAKQAEGVE